jgi:hypothetical protein
MPLKGKEKEQIIKSLNTSDTKIQYRKDNHTGISALTTSNEYDA